MRVPFVTACVLAAVTFSATGCVTPAATARQGPPALAAEQARATRLLSRLAGTIEGRTVHVTVNASPAVGAYAWPEGRLLLTSGLARLLDDDELSAAVAHELGHLVADGRMQAVAALNGTGATSSAADAESLADAAGSRLLTSAGYPPEAMPRMLEKVAAAPGTSKALRSRLLRRAAALRHSLVIPLTVTR